MSLTQEQLQEERTKLDLEWEKLRQERTAFESERESSGVEVKLFVGNLDETTEEEEVRSLFSAYGNIKEIIMLKTREGKSKRSCFVKFFSKSAADASVEALAGKHKDKDSNQMLVVRYAKDKNAAPAMNAGYGGGFNQSYGASGFSNGGYGGYGVAAPAPSNYGGMPAAGGFGGASTGGAAGFGRGPSGANLYINNLSRAASENDVQTMFGDFGRVISVKLFGDAGYGFVSFDNVQSAQNAISCLNGLAMGDGSKRLEVSVKKDKGASRFSPY